MYRSTKAVIALALSGVFLCGTAVGQSGPEYPDDIAGTRLRALADALNIGQESAWQDFILSNWKPAPDDEAFEGRVGFFQFLFDDLGGIELVDIKLSDEREIIGVFKAAAPRGTTEFMELHLWLQEEAPHLVDKAGARPTDDPMEQLPGPDATDEEIEVWLDGYLQELVAEDKFSGAVLVARNGDPFYKKAFGLATKRWNVSNQLDTKFNLGSMNKMFTGVAIAQLAGRGELSFQDFVGKHLPDYPNQDVREKVTLHHLLTHTSGMGSYWEELFDSHWWEIKTVQQLADLTAEKPLQFEPGDRFSYSNAGPIVLGLIIEKLSGLSYDEYIRRNVTGPAGMINTDCYEVDTPTPNLAVGYTKMNYGDDHDFGDKYRNNLFMHASKGGPAGGGYSTVEDLLRFDIALRSGTLVSKEMAETLWTSKTGDQGYGYLFGENTDYEGERIVGHNGGAPGISATLDMYLNRGYTVAVMANYDGAASTVARKLERILTRKPR